MYRFTTVLGLSLLAACGSSDGAADAEQTAKAGEVTAAYQATDPNQAATEVRAVIAAYDSAVSASDTARAVSLLHPELVVYEHGHVEGSRDAFAKDHLLADMEFMRNATMERGDRGVHVASGNDIAWTISPYELRGEYKGKKVHNAGTETLVLVRGEDGWKIRHAHYSGHKIEAGK